MKQSMSDCSRWPVCISNSPVYILVFLTTGVCISVFVCAVHMPVETRGQHQVFSSVTSHYILKTNLSQLFDQWSLRILLSLPLQHWDCRCMPLHTAPYTVARDQTPVPMLVRKTLYWLAISPALLWCPLQYNLSQFFLISACREQCFPYPFALLNMPVLPGPQGQ